MSLNLEVVVKKLKRFDIWCYGCVMLAHIAKDCRGGHKRSDDPNAGSRSKRARQANQEVKAG